MAYLVRKIAPAKWSGVQSLEALSADALTADLRTTDNTLSLWEIGSKDELSNAVLALAVSKQAKKFEKMDLVLIPKETILAKQLSIGTNPGETLAEGLSNTHREVVDLKYPSLGVFAQIIIDLLAKNDPTTILRSEVVDIVKAACDNKTINISSLPEDMQKIIKNNTDPKPIAKFRQQ
jgi:hypothetical protein